MILTMTILSFLQSICLGMCSNPPLPTCPSPSIFGAGHHDLDDEDVSFDVSSSGAMVCPPTNSALFVPLSGSS